MEKAFSVVHRDLCKLFWRKSFLFRDIVSDDGNEGRRVPLAAIGDRGQIGGVRLQHDPFRRRDGESFADVDAEKTEAEDAQDAEDAANE